ncbi:MAG: DUF3822 family protein [Flavobacteriales bacterium]
MVIGESDTSFIHYSEELDIDYSNSTVSIAADEHSVSFGVFDNFTSEILHLERHSLLDEQLDLLKFPFAHKDLGALVLTQKGGNSTLVPTSLARGKEQQELNSFLNKGKIMSSNRITSLEAEVYYNKLEIIKWIESEFPQSKVQHNSKPLIDNILETNRYQKGMKIYGDISEHTLELVVIRNNQLIKYTTEQFQTATDLLFHLTAQIEIHGFNQLEDFLFLSGLIDNTASVYTELKRYIKNIRLNSGLTYQKISKSLGVVPKHHFFTVLNAYQCV